MMKISETDNGRAEIYTPYSPEFVNRIRMIGGAKWDSAKKCWTIPAEAVDNCRDIMRDVYGEADIPDTEPRLKLRVKFLRDDDASRGPYMAFGKMIADARGRNSGARPGDGVVFVEGAPRSGGSAKNWLSIVPEGCVVELRDVPRAMYERDRDREIFGEKVFEVTVLGGLALSEEEIKKELDALRAKRDEIDRRIAELMQKKEM